MLTVAGVPLDIGAIDHQLALLICYLRQRRVTKGNQGRTAGTLFSAAAFGLLLSDRTRAVPSAHQADSWGRTSERRSAAPRPGLNGGRCAAIPIAHPHSGLLEVRAPADVPGTGRRRRVARRNAEIAVALLDCRTLAERSRIGFALIAQETIAGSDTGAGCAAYTSPDSRSDRTSHGPGLSAYCSRRSLRQQSQPAYRSGRSHGSPREARPRNLAFTRYHLYRVLERALCIAKPLRLVGFHASSASFALTTARRISRAVATLVGRKFRCRLESA